MARKIDYASLRLLPYSILVSFIAMPLLAIVAILLIASAVNVGITNSDIYDFIGATFSNGIFITYAAVIASMICLYRLNDSSKWFHFAWICFAVELVIKLIVQICSWFYAEFPKSLLAGVTSVTTYPLPDICFLLGIVFVMKGLVSMNDEMGKKNTGKFRSLGNFFVVIQVIRLILIFLLYVEILICRVNGYTDYSTMPVALLASFIVMLCASIILLVYHAILGLLLYVRMRDVCQEYYIFSYNNTNRL